MADHNRPDNNAFIYLYGIFMVIVVIRGTGIEVLSLTDPWVPGKSRLESLSGLPLLSNKP